VTTDLAPPLSAFFAENEAVERLVQVLALAQGFHLHIVLCNSQYVSRTLIDELQQRVSNLRGTDVETDYFDLFEGLSDDAIRDGKHIENLLIELTRRQSKPLENALFYVDGTAPVHIEDAAWQRLFERLNQRRDVIAALVGAPLTLIIPERVVGLLAASAPDLWSFRAAQVVISPPTDVLSAGMLVSEQTSTVEFRSNTSKAAVSIDFSAIEEARREANLSPADTATLHRLVILLERAAEQLASIGQLEQALRLTQEAVDVARKRVALTSGTQAKEPSSEQRSDEVLSSLAMSLNNASIRLNQLGRHEDALAAAREALETFQNLALTRADAFLPDLATSLNNLGASENNLGRYAEALSVTREATEIRRRLARSRPETYLPGLAMSLLNLYVALSNADHREETLPAISEATEIFRNLARLRPDAFTPGLASSLINLGLELASRGQPEAALDATGEAVALCRRLASTQPSTFLPNLATSLNNLSVNLVALGHYEAALAAAREATDAYRSLSRIRPKAYGENLAKSLVNLNSVLRNLGQLEEAERVTVELDSLNVSST
jgi:tetratricopeptide (TPR) repeat protein